MNNDQGNSPVYDNLSFSHEEESPPPYSPHPEYPSVPQEPPSYIEVIAQTVNTHHTVTPGNPHVIPQKKGRRHCRPTHLLFSLLGFVFLLAVIGVLLWFFFYKQCFLGKPCRHGMCLSHSQWCDGVKHCLDGEDEAHCFRLYGNNSMLQLYSPKHQSWMPVCADKWTDYRGREACERIGYDRVDYVSYSRISAGSLASKGYMGLMDGVYIGPLQKLFTHRQRCSPGAVKLQCIACGQSYLAPNTRIVGGTQAVNGAWPWQVSLQLNQKPTCGGSIISPYWILSAAHCFQNDSSSKNWKVYYGSNRLSKLKSIKVKKIIKHEKYNTKTFDNDIALIKLDKRLQTTSAVKPVCLPNVGVNLYPGRQGWITGWGALHSSKSSTDILNQAKVTIYDSETCNKYGILNGKVTKTMFCAGDLKGGVDTCQGDSGGPLVVNDGDVWWLTGDTSWGIGCAQRNRPGVYGNISYFTEWIYEQMQDD